MSKFNVGDKVRMLQMPSNCTGTFHKDLIGSIVTITNIAGRGIMIINNNEWGCNVLEKDVEPVKIINWKERIRRGER